MNTVTKADLAAALEAWNQARQKAALEHDAWGLVLRNHGQLIRSLTDNGWNFGEAKQGVDDLSDSHKGNLLAAWADMDAKCSEYQDLEKIYKAGNP